MMYVPSSETASHILWHIPSAVKTPCWPANAQKLAHSARYQAQFDDHRIFGRRSPLGRIAARNLHHRAWSAERKGDPAVPVPLRK
jgi:hypothetical protein